MFLNFPENIVILKKINTSNGAKQSPSDKFNKEPFVNFVNKKTITSDEACSINPLKEACAGN